VLWIHNNIDIGSVGTKVNSLYRYVEFFGDPDRHVFGLPGSGSVPLVRGRDPDPSLFS
jgi:hypothetical protein